MARWDSARRALLTVASLSALASAASLTTSAGGGIMRTFKAVADDVRDQLEVLWESPGYTPHAFAAHRRVPQALRDKVLAALESLSADDDGKALLEPLKISAIEAVTDGDWDDVRALNIQVR